MKTPFLADLNNYLATLRKKQFERNMNPVELAAWCLDHCDVPEDLDDPFVVDYNFFF